MHHPLKIKIIIIIITGLFLFFNFNTTNLFNDVNASKTEEIQGVSNDSSTLSKSFVNHKEIGRFDTNIVQDIELKDDAFHGYNDYFSIEWWYFDAILNDDYDLHAGFKVFSIKSIGVVWPIFEIYKGRELIVKILKPYPLKDLSASLIYPSVKVAGKSIIEFDINEYYNTGKWKYNISINMKNHAINLTFVGITKGWKYMIMDREGWAVALPKADVFGTITIDGKIINVTGRGYHDHNWNYTIKTKAREWGWYWVRLTGNMYSLISAWFLKSPFDFDNLVVLNKDYGDYIEINPKDIKLFFLNNISKNGAIIPSQFRIIISNFSVKVDVLMNATSIHFVGSPRFFYCRYFVNVTGFISKDDDVEHFVDSLQMFEFMKFK